MILEVNPNIPRCLGGSEEFIHISEVDYIVKANWPIASIPSSKSTDVDKRIASLIMNELEDGSCIQLGTTYNKGETLASRIKPILTPGATVTATRTMASYIVTEYGLINLKGKSTWERAEAIISLAHPAFRDELVLEAERIGIWRRSNKIN